MEAEAEAVATRADQDYFGSYHPYEEVHDYIEKLVRAPSSTPKPGACSSLKVLIIHGRHPLTFRLPIMAGGYVPEAGLDLRHRQVLPGEAHEGHPYLLLTREEQADPLVRRWHPRQVRDGVEGTGSDVTC